MASPSSLGPSIASAWAPHHPRGTASTASQMTDVAMINAHLTPRAGRFNRARTSGHCHNVTGSGAARGNDARRALPNTAGPGTFLTGDSRRPARQDADARLAFRAAAGRLTQRMVARFAMVGLLLLSGTALGVNPKVSALNNDAQALYNKGDFAGALKLLLEANQIEPSATLTYNLARTYDNLAENEKALEYYRKYVGLPSTETDPDKVRKANQNMDRLRNLLARQEADSRIRDAEKARLEKEARDARQKAESEGERARRQKAEFEAKEKARLDAEQSKTSGRKVATFVVGGIGLAALASGLVLGLLSSSSKTAFRAATLLEDKRARQGDTVTQSLVADVSLLVGVACAVTALILFPKGEAEGAAAGLSFSPLPGGGAFGVLQVPL
jgi:tetratricopeptide (TPR) repeat protein